METRENHRAANGKKNIRPAEAGDSMLIPFEIKQLRTGEKMAPGINVPDANENLTATYWG